MQTTSFNSTYVGFLLASKLLASKEAKNNARVFMALSDSFLFYPEKRNKLNKKNYCIAKLKK